VAVETAVRVKSSPHLAPRTSKGWPPSLMPLTSASVIFERDRVWYSRQPGYFLSTRLLEPLGAMSAPAFPRISMRILRPEWRCPVLEDG